MSDTHGMKLRITMGSGRVLHIDPSWKGRVEWSDPFLHEVIDHGPPRPCTCCPWTKPEVQRLQIKPADASIVEEIRGCWLSDDELTAAEREQSFRWAEFVKSRPRALDAS